MSDTFPASEGAFSSQGKKPPRERSVSEDEPVPVVVSVKQAKPPSVFVRYGWTVLVATVVSAVVATGVSVIINLIAAGIGPRDDRFIQEGNVTVPLNGEREVFYAIPFAGPPNLDLRRLNGDINALKIKEQKADRFVLRYEAGMGFPAELHWRAEGMRVK